MTLKEVLAVLSENNIRLGLEQDKLKIRAAKGAMTAEIKALLVKFKPQLLEWVKSTQENRNQQAPIPKRSDKEEQALSFTQQRLWFIDQLNPGDPSYNVPAAIKVSGPLDIPVLQRVFDEILQRHEILRTNFINLQGEASQRLNIALVLPINVETLDQPASQQTLLDLASAEASRPFNLANDALIRVRLIKLESDSEHLLLLNLHHIVTDGWSNGVIMKEVSELYQAFINGLPSPLKELPIQYADFAVWQRNFLSEEKLAEKLSYWQDKLADLPILELPCDHPRPVQRSGRGCQINFSIPTQITAQLNTLAQKHSTTLFIVLMAAFNTLLHRYTGQQDICVGTPTAGRNRAELTDLIGFFINTLALRSDLSGNPSFTALIAQLNQTMREAQEHQDVPFENIVESLGLSRDMSTTPIFQTLLVLQNAPMAEELAQSKLSFEMLAADSRSAKFDLSFNLKEFDGQLIGCAEFDTDLFEDSTIERMLEHFENLLGSIVEDPSQPISALSLLSSEEYQQVVLDWNKTRAIYPRNMSMASQFETLVGKQADKLAIDFPDQQLSYGELDAQASQLAHKLSELGVKRGDHVAICIDRSVEMIIGLVAILKLGAAYIPLDPDYPEDRLVFMLEDTAASLIITVKDNRERLQSLPLQQLPNLLVLDQQADEIAAQPNQWQSASDNDGGEQLAYIMYTSGSTGQPKGVMIPQRAIIRLVKNSNFVDLGPDDATGHISNVCFDAATLEFWGALLNGGRIVGIPKEILLDRAAFESTLRDKQVTTMFITVTLFNLYTSEAPTMFSSVKNLLVGGEALDPNKIRQILAAEPPARLLNGYGPTENTTFTTYYEINSLADDVSSVPLGYPLANTTTYILDSNRQPVPIGVPGELCTGGDGVALGYLNREELSQEKFILDPFSDKKDALMYCTGDICRWLPDGRIEMTGRVDDQVKIRGFRIELGEIDNVLGQVNGVRECAVVVRNDESGGKYLAGYVVSETTLADEEAQQAYIQSLRLALQDQLPFYMLPTALVVMDALPLTNNGKLDKRALPEPDLSQQLSHEYVAPRNEQEQQLADIWQEVLNVDKIGIHDNFFELGGHSLLATRVISRISERLGAELALKSLFEAPTIIGLIEQLQQSSTALTLPPLEKADRSQPLPVSYAQQRLWIIDQIQPGSPMYNVPMALRIHGNLDIKILEKSLAEIIKRHDSLRTRFAQSGDDVYQIVDDYDGWQLEVFEVDNKPEQIIQRAQAYLLASFELTQGPLVRLQLLKIKNNTEEQHILLACMHHIISDGWSVNVMLGEITALYQAYSQQENSPLPALDYQYADFSAWQHNWLQGDILDQQLGYWREQLSDVPVLELPCDHPRPAVMDAFGKTLSFELDQQLSQQLLKLGQSQDSTLFMTLLAAFQVLMYRYSGQSDFAIGSPIANRKHPALEPMIGFFVNTLVLRNPLDPNSSFKQLLASVKESTLGAYQHQDVPFEKLIDELQIPRSLSHTPLFQVMFILQNTASANSSEFSSGELGFSSLLAEGEQQSAAKFDLTMSLSESSEGIKGSLEFRAALFENSSIERLIRCYKELLQGIVSDPEQSLAKLPLLEQSDKKSLQALSQGDKAESFNCCVHQLFEQQVEKTPATIAVRCAEQILSYQQLNQRANQLARHLVAQGVKQGQKIGACLYPSVDVLVTLLGIMKTGAAYVPMDPSYPDDRLQHMQNDAAMPLTLCHSDLSERFNGISSNNTSIITIESLADTLPDYDDGNLALDNDVENLLYVVYTSGSTGLPKGAGVRHRNAINLLHWYCQQYQLGSDDKALIISPLGFDLTQKNLFALLSCGGEVVFPDSRHYDNQLIETTVKSQQITMINCAPSAFYPLVEYSNDLSQLASLRWVLFGGENIQMQVMHNWFERSDCKVKIVNMYGPTECTDIAATYTIDSPADYSKSGVPIGHPNSNIEVYLLDEQLQQVPQGVIGELHIGGAGVGSGYLNNEVLSAEKFITYPSTLTDFASEDRKLYRSGDLVRYNYEGELEFISRSDGQVKIRGLRIELGEIEAVINQQPQVQEAVVNTFEHAANTVLIAYIVPSAVIADSDFDSLQLRNSLKQTLPEYMVPSAIVAIDKIPLSANGKVDRKALPAPDTEAFASTRYVEPEGEVEQQLAQLWTQVLQVEKVGRHDNFFECGGHSLMAIKLAALIRSQFEVELALTAIFEMSTLEEMAAFVDNILWARQDNSMIEQADNEDREEFEL